jgi:hypothetical protein
VVDVPESLLDWQSALNRALATLKSRMDLSASFLALRSTRCSLAHAGANTACNATLLEGASRWWVKSV